MILLDTHVLLWFRSGDRRLGRRARRTVERALPQRRGAVSAISFWEVAMRVHGGGSTFSRIRKRGAATFLLKGSLNSR